MEQNFDIIYCANRKCNNDKCLRHYRHEPWDVMIKEMKYEPDKNGKCKHEVIE